MKHSIKHLTWSRLLSRWRKTMSRRRVRAATRPRTEARTVCLPVTASFKLRGSWSRNTLSDFRSRTLTLRNSNNKNNLMRIMRILPSSWSKEPMTSRKNGRGLARTQTSWTHSIHVKAASKSRNRRHHALHKKKQIHRLIPWTIKVASNKNLLNVPEFHWLTKIQVITMLHH